MKTLIISIYDSGYGFSVCINGTVHKYNNYYGDDKDYPANKPVLPFLKAYNDREKYGFFDWHYDYEKVFAKFLDDYDFVAICENGHIYVLKGGEE